MSKALLVLEDGRSFPGRSFGADGEAIAEIVFNTSMTGYQEILTDPSYAGQLVVMTVSHVGNYGVTPEDEEADGPKAVGFAVRERCPTPSNHRSKGDLEGYLKRYGLLGIDEIDTRALTRHLRTRGAMMGAVSTTDLDEKRLHERLKGAPGMAGRDLVPLVTCKAPYTVAGYRSARQGPASRGGAPHQSEQSPSQGDTPIVVIDCGVKRSTLERLAGLGGRVTVVPAATTAAEILERSPAGVLVSNGPGDPAAVTYTIETLRGLLGKVPIFGICLGHQLLGLALGGRTYKLKFGHRGGNQPVRDLRTGQVCVSSHNHGFSVDIDSLKGMDVEPWFVNLNDQTNEGLRCEKLRVASVQFHPEAAPGPNDCRYLFDDWMKSIRSAR